MGYNPPRVYSVTSASRDIFTASATLLFRQAASICRLSGGYRQDKSPDSFYISSDANTRREHKDET
jgi:hypothetical protein